MRLTVLAISALALMAGPASAQSSLYQRLGGYPAIKAVVDDFVGNVAADKRINRFFAKSDIPRLKQNLVDQICQFPGQHFPERVGQYLRTVGDTARELLEVIQQTRIAARLRPRHLRHPFTGHWPLAAAGALVRRGEFQDTERAVMADETD